MAKGLGIRGPYIWRRYMPGMSCTRDVVFGDLTLEDLTSLDHTVHNIYTERIRLGMTMQVYIYCIHKKVIKVMHRGPVVHIALHIECIHPIYLQYCTSHPGGPNLPNISAIGHEFAPYPYPTANQPITKGAFLGEFIANGGSIDYFLHIYRFKIITKYY